MLIPNDQNNNVPGGNPQPNPENAPVLTNISDARDAFMAALGALSATGSETTPSLEVGDQGNSVIPANEEGSVIDNNNTPAATIETPTTPQPQPDLTLEAIRDSILSEIRTLQSANAQPPVNQESGVETPPVEEGLNINDDEFMESFSANPVQAVMQIADQIADQKAKAQVLGLVEKLQPLIQQSEQIAFQNSVRDTLSQFAAMEDYPDAQKYFPHMVEIIKANNLPKNDIKTYIDTYKDVALADLRANRGRSLDEYLTDDNEVSKIVADPKIKDMIINAYLEDLAKGGKPQVITNGSNVNTPAAPPTEFKTFDEAGKAFGQHLYR